MQNFTSFCQSLKGDDEEQKTAGPEHFQIFKDIQTVNGRKGGEVFYHFLNKIFDKSEKEIEETLPIYLDQLIQSKTLDMMSFSKGVQKYLHMVPNIAADYPKLAEWISSVIYQLFSQNALTFKEI